MGDRRCVMPSKARHGVVAAEAERVGDADGAAVGGGQRPRAVRHVVEVQALVALLPADRGRRDAGRAARARWRRPRPRRPRRAGGRSTDLVDDTGTCGVVAEHGLDGARLGGVVERRRGAVRVDVVDVAGVEAGVAQRGGDGARGAVAVGLRARSGGRRPTWRRSRAPRRGPRRRGPRRGRRPPARGCPAPSPMTKPSRRASNGREMPESDSASIAAKAAWARSVWAASAPPVIDRVAVAGGDRPGGGADRVGAGRAGRHRPEHLAAEAVAHRQRGRRGVGHHQRDRQRRHGLVAAQPVVAAQQRADAADPGADDAADAVGVVGSPGPSRPAPPRPRRARAG